MERFELHPYIDHTSQCVESENSWQVPFRSQWNVHPSFKSLESLLTDCVSPLELPEEFTQSFMKG